MTEKTYSEKLKDPRWQKKRLEILNRDGFKCVYCEDEKSTLHVHHRLYLKGCSPWEYDNRLLETVCQACHQEEEEASDMLDSIIHDFVISGVNKSELYNMLNRAFHEYKEHGVIS